MYSEPAESTEAAGFSTLRRPSARVPRLPCRLCVAVTGTSVQELLARSAALLPQHPLQELRFDFLPAPLTAMPALRDHCARHAATLLATCRRQVSGGHFNGSPEQELEVLLEAARAGCALVDLSIESVEMLPSNAVAQLRAQGAAVLLSWHDFERTGDLGAVLERMRRFAPDLYKIVPTATTLSDNLKVLALLRANTEIPVVAMAMGEAGIPSRVLGVRGGAAFTFAAATPAEATAPGQLTADALRTLYCVDSLSPATQIYGVAGHPVRSSRSPLMLNTAFANEALDAVYLPLLTDDPEALFHFGRELPLSGFSVTMPLKQRILPLLRHLDPLAEKIGAVNTVRREPDGSFSGFNTDAAGIVGPLEQRLPLQGARVLVLGAGGAARAAVFACVERGAAVSILNRTHATAAALAEDSGAAAIREEDLAELRPFDVLINATPAGMQGNATELPLRSANLPAKLVFDLVYNPLDTSLLRIARAQGLAVIPGIEMFVHQGARQFELWTGRPAPVDLMRKVVLESLAT